MPAAAEATPFEALDECHRQITAHLEALTALARRIEAKGVDEAAQQQAGAIEAFYSSTGQEHHAQEERAVFPALLASGDAALVSTVRTLQQDHGWIEENWIELAPQLSAIASGNNWPDPAEFLHCVQVFVELCTNHIALEESVVYPESRARWARALEARRLREKAPPA